MKSVHQTGGTPDCHQTVSLICDRLPVCLRELLFFGEVAMIRLISVLTVAMLAWGMATTTALAEGRWDLQVLLCAYFVFIGRVLYS